MIFIGLIRPHDNALFIGLYWATRVVLARFCARPILFQKNVTVGSDQVPFTSVEFDLRHFWLWSPILRSGKCTYCEVPPILRIFGLAWCYPLVFSTVQPSIHRISGLACFRQPGVLHRSTFDTLYLWFGMFWQPGVLHHNNGYINSLTSYLL